MKNILAGLACILITAGVSSAQPRNEIVPPTLKIVVSVEKEKGQIIYLETVARVVPVVKEVIEIQNGQQVKKVVTEYVSVLEQRHVVADIAKSKIITPDGKQLPIDEVWKRLKKDSVFAISGNGNTPAQAFLKVLNADTLVVIAPAMPPAPILVPQPQPQPPEKKKV